MITNRQSNFYLRYNLEVHAYLKLRPELKYWFIKWSLLTILGETEYLLEVLTTQIASNCTYTWMQISEQLGGLNKIIQICNLLKIESDSSLDGDRYHYLINNVSVNKAVDILTIERNQLINKVETELGISIDSLKLIIISIGDASI